jgi:hypothetical protein
MLTIQFLLSAIFLRLARPSNTTLLWGPYLYLNEDIYNLQRFNDGKDYELQTTEGAIYFRIAKFTQYSCNGEVKSYAVGDIGGGCEPFTKGNIDPLMFTGERNPESEQFEFTINYTNISYSGKKLYIHSICQPNSSLTENVSMSIQKDTIYITIFSNSVCPILVGIKSMWFYFSQYKVAFFIVFVILGLVLTLFGIRIFKVVLFIIGFLIVILVINVTDLSDCFLPVYTSNNITSVGILDSDRCFNIIWSRRWSFVRSILQSWCIRIRILSRDCDRHFAIFFFHIFYYCKVMGAGNSDGGVRGWLWVSGVDA